MGMNKPKESVGRLRCESLPRDGEQVSYDRKDLANAMLSSKCFFWTQRTSSRCGDVKCLPKVELSQEAVGVVVQPLANSGVGVCPGRTLPYPKVR
jgi:hypothetical protein